VQKTQQITRIHSESCSETPPRLEQVHIIEAAVTCICWNPRQRTQGERWHGGRDRRFHSGDCDVMPCSVVDRHKRFGVTCYLHLQIIRISRASLFFILFSLFHCTFVPPRPRIIFFSFHCFFVFLNPLCPLYLQKMALERATVFLLRFCRCKNEDRQTYGTEVLCKSIVACRPVARQRPRYNQLYNNRCYVTAPPTDLNATIPRQQPHCKRGAVFSMRSVPRCYKQDK
jgi:hypothetical protein